MGVTKNALEELLERAGGCAVIDGGFATQLEALGADINDPLWSALCLISNPDLIKKVTFSIFFVVSSMLCMHVHAIFHFNDSAPDTCQMEQYIFHCYRGLTPI